MKLALVFVFVFVLSLMPTSLLADTIYSQFNYWQAPCDGYTLGLQPWGCVTGEVRYFSSLGEVLTQYLKPAFSSMAYTPDQPIIPITPEQPYMPPYEPPPATATPEPGVFWLLLTVVVIIALKRSNHHEKDS